MAINKLPTDSSLIQAVEKVNELETYMNTINRGGARTITPKTTNQVLNSGIYTGNITVAGDADLIASNIIAGKNIFGVAGNFDGKKWASGTAYCDSNLSKKFERLRSTAQGTRKYVDINLNFNASVIIVYRHSDVLISRTSTGFTVFIANEYCIEDFLYSDSSIGYASGQYKAGSDMVNGTTYSIPIVLTGGVSQTFDWIAYE